jgi:hypothetical protein
LLRAAFTGNLHYNTAQLGIAGLAGFFTDDLFLKHRFYRI